MYSTYVKAFALSGLDAAHTQGAAVAYMMNDLHDEGAVLDYPMGGMGSLIDTLVSGLKKNDGELRVNSRVDKFILSGEKKPECEGVVLEDGTIIRARKGVVSNVPLWNMSRILDESVKLGEHSKVVVDTVNEIQEEAENFQMTGSFMHLHLGIPSDGLGEIECHYSVLNMDKDITAKQNLVIISIPTVFDPSLAPEGYHIVHAYTAASEDFEEWERFLEDERGSDTTKIGNRPSTGKAQQYGKMEGYDELKDIRAEALWKAIEQIIPDIRDRAEAEGAIKMVGTPLTHRRYNMRHRKLNCSSTRILNVYSYRFFTFQAELMDPHLQ